MLTSHARYIEGHEALYAVANKDDAECFKVAEYVVENYLNNRWIWDELDHYGRTGKLLGLHPIFERRNREREMEEMDAIALSKLYRNLPRSIHYYVAMLKDDKDSEEQLRRKNRLEWLRWEFNVVKRLLRINDGTAKNGKSGNRKKRRVIKKGK